MKEQENAKKSYTSPIVEQLGAVRELTLGSHHNDDNNNQQGVWNS